MSTLKKKKLPPGGDDEEPTPRRALRRRSQHHEDENKVVCDICWLDREPRLSDLVTCRKCGVVVHPECYGFVEETSVEIDKSTHQFTCWACQAVGTTVKFRERDNASGRRIQTTIRHRPKDCILCNAPDAELMHALHPVYDDYGTKARQIMLPNRKPAWVHTLCAMVLSTKSGGLIYGCFKNGRYKGDDEPDTERVHFEDDASVNSQFEIRSEAEGEDTSLHHFAYVLPLWYKPSQGHLEFREERKLFECRGCKRDGRGRGNYSVALHCSVGDEDEHRALSQDDQGHDIHLNESCTVPWHPGCARYWKNERGEYPGIQTVFFYPGHIIGRREQKPVSACYCPKHAMDTYDFYATLHGEQKRLFGARFPPHCRVAPVDAVGNEAEIRSDNEDGEFRNNPNEEDSADEDLDAYADDGNDDNDDDDDDDIDRKPKAKKSRPSQARAIQEVPQKKRKRAPEEAKRTSVASRNSVVGSQGRDKPTNEVGRGSVTVVNKTRKAALQKFMETKTNGQKAPPAPDAGSSSNPASGIVVKKEGEQEDEEPGVIECIGYGAQFFMAKSKTPETREVVSKLFGILASKAVANLSEAIREGRLWGYGPPWIGALETDDEDWCKLRQQHPDPDMRQGVSFHDVECDLTSSGSSRCLHCRNMRKRLNQALKKLSDQENE